MTQSNEERDRYVLLETFLLLDDLRLRGYLESDIRVNRKKSKAEILKYKKTGKPQATEKEITDMARVLLSMDISELLSGDDKSHSLN